MPSLVSLVSKVRDRGMRGTASTVLNRAAQALARKPLRPTVRLPDGRTEYTNWLTFAVPGMLSLGNVSAVSHGLCCLVKGGFVLLDDSGEGSGWGVCRIVDEVIAGGRYRIIANEPNYMFQKLS